MKTIKRKYYESIGSLETKIGYFIATGQWADGHLAYSRLDNDGNIIEDEEGLYVQLRSERDNTLFMLHI